MVNSQIWRRHDTSILGTFTTFADLRITLIGALIQQKIRASRRLAIARCLSSVTPDILSFLLFTPSGYGVYGNRLVEPQVLILTLVGRERVVFLRVKTLHHELSVSQAVAVSNL